MKPKSTRSTKRTWPDDQSEVLPALEQQIDENLRLIYRQCVEEGIPQSLQSLVDELHRQLAQRESRSEAGESPSRDKSQRLSGPRSA